MKHHAKNGLAALTGLLVAIIIFEIVLRFYNPFGFRQKGDKIVLPTHTSQQYKNISTQGLDSVIIHSKNNLGFRGPDWPVDPQQKTTIFAIGGSTTECYYLSDGKDWPARLQSRFSSVDRNIWINNAGLDGHSTFGHQILLTDYISPLKPNMVLLLVGCNEVGRVDLTAYDKQQMQRESGDWRRVLVNNSEVASLLANLRRYLRAKEMGLLHTGVSITEMKLLTSLDSLAIQRTISDHLVFQDSYARRLRSLLHSCHDAGITPVLITQPSLVGVGQDSLTGVDLERIDFCHDLGGKAYWEILEVYNQTTRDVAKESHIQLIDLAHLIPKSSAYFYDCVHFTNAGAEKVAEIVFGELLGVALGG